MKYVRLKYILAFALLTAIVSFGLNSMAQQVYIKQNKDPVQAPAAKSELEDLRTQPRIQLKETAKPAPVVGNEKYANNFYKKCVAQDHPLLKGEMLDMFCGCTSAQIIKSMTQEQIQTMNTDTKAGLHQRHRMMILVYAPCIEFPTRALVLDQCLTQKDKMKHARYTCACVAKNVGDYMKIHAPSSMERAIMSNPVDAELDPLRVLMESPDFDAKTRQYMNTCVAKHEFGR